MGYIVIAPVGDNPKALFVGMKQFPTEKVFLISPEAHLKTAKELSKKLDEFTIASSVIEIGTKVLTEMFIAFGRICAMYPSENIIVNVATGDRMTTCAALSAAYANGLKAFGVDGQNITLLPIMKLSYFEEIGEKKRKILSQLQEDNYLSFKELSKRLKMAPSLLWYHTHGNGEFKGLKDLRLVDIKEGEGVMSVKLSELGSLLIKGHIKTKTN